MGSGVMFAFRPEDPASQTRFNVMSLTEAGVVHYQTIPDIGNYDATISVNHHLYFVFLSPVRIYVANANGNQYSYIRPFNGELHDVWNTDRDTYFQIKNTSNGLMYNVVFNANTRTWVEYPETEPYSNVEYYMRANFEFQAYTV
jgi:hypothetical protein